MNWSTYERLKAAWIAANPNASQAAYEAAMRDIARKAGV